MATMRACYAVLWLSFGPALALADFPGWQGLRVLEQEGRPYVLRSADIDQDGRDELLVVNSRYSRLDVYHWLAEDERQEAGPTDPARPNDLVATNEIRADEIQLEYLPLDVIATSPGDETSQQLVILVSPPNRVLVYRRDEQQAWQQQYSIDLLEGDVSSRREPMLLRDKTGGVHELLVGMSDGIQRVDLRRDGRARWLTPREKRDRLDWWLADLDGDGDEDLIELSRDSSQAVRWYACAANGDLIAAQGLLDRSTDSGAVVRSDAGAELVVLDGSVQGMVRHYRIDTRDAEPLGNQHALPLVGGNQSTWRGMQQGDQPALVVTDPNRPRLLCYKLGEEGWQAERVYPSISNIQAIAAVVAQPGTLLIWAKDAADLQISKWNSARLSFPQAWPQSTDEQDRRILALAQVGSTTWWVQKVDSDLDLYRWGPDQEEPSRVRFVDVGSKADQVLWIGGDRLLVKDTHARGLKYIRLADDQTVSTQPTHLERAALAEFKLLAGDDGVRLGRLTDGVLQLLGDDLQPYDQIMLPEGLELADYVAQGEATGWGLQAKASFIHRFEGDEAGIPQVTERIKIPGGSALVDDHYLGLLLLNYNSLIRLRDGEQRELKLLDIIDQRVARHGGIRETHVHRLGTTDVDGDGCEDLILFDDRDHRLSVLTCEDGKFAPRIAWPVFDDKEYPYGDDTSGLVQEPRAVRGLDFDGDGHRDLAMLCHDRLLIYLGREKP